jgi:hypothetical protein
MAVSGVGKALGPSIIAPLFAWSARPPPPPTATGAWDLGPCPGPSSIGLLTAVPHDYIEHTLFFLKTCAKPKFENARLSKRGFESHWSKIFDR